LIYVPLNYKIIIFIIASAPIVWISRFSLRNFRSHGFYRFFAWEAILALILLNINYWFYQPFGIRQLVSWLLLIASLYLVIRGMQLLGREGKRDNHREDPSLLDLEKTTALVTRGLYRHIRHPLYSSLLFLTWGAFFKMFSAAGLGLAISATIFLTVTAKMEEAENITFFGPTYKSYMSKTKMFIPKLF